MSDDPVADYSQALQDRGAAIAAAERMVSRVTDGANKLREWRRVSVSNLRPAVSFPAGSHRIITGDAWPSAQEIAETIKAYHDAGGAAREAWSRIPAGQRGAMTPPPDPYE